MSVLVAKNESSNALTLCRRARSKGFGEIRDSGTTLTTVSQSGTVFVSCSGSGSLSVIIVKGNSDKADLPLVLRGANTRGRCTCMGGAALTTKFLGRCFLGSRRDKHKLVTFSCSGSN